MKFLLWLWRDIKFTLSNEVGGGQKSQPPQIIPAPEPPNYNETAGQVAQAQLQYNPQLTAQNVQLQGQYGPQLARQQYDIAAQYSPMYRALIEQQFPQIGQLSGQVSQQMNAPQLSQDQLRQQAAGRVSSQYADVLGPQAISQYQNPIGLTPQQQAAQDAVRQRALDVSERGVRSAANLGGTLYGGQSQLREDRSRNELLQGFAVEDIDRQERQRQQSLQQLLAAQGVQGGLESQRQQFGMQDIGAQQQQRQQTMSELATLFQLAFPNVQQPGQVGMNTGVQGGTSDLYNALVQNNSNFGVIPGTPGTPGYFGSFVNAYRGI